MLARLRVVTWCAVAVLSSCSENIPPGGGTKPGGGLGDACTDFERCRAGLSCDSTSKTCVGSMSLDNGAPCTIGPECQSGYCAPNGPKGACATAGTLPKGAECQGDGQCAAGLKCSFDGQSLFPKCVDGGSLDVGRDCTAARECAQGLFCQAGKCAFVPVTATMAPNGYPPFIPSPTLQWQGASCPAPKTTGVSALFSIPRAGDADAVKQDFFRLPFPNDAARAADGTLDFSRFPRDPNPPFGFDALGRYLDLLKSEPFGNYPTVIFRFDGSVKFSGFNANGANPQTRIVDLTAGPRFGQRRGLFYQLSGGRNRYVCPNWFAVRPFTGDALLPGTYAVMLLKGIKASDDTDVQTSGDFQALIGASVPADPQLAAAYPSYAPLRTYLAMQSISPSDVLVASVFTVGDPQRLMASLDSAVAAAGAPQVEPWVKCGGGAVSPCATACTAPAAFDEWHTRIELPIFQEGTAPYLTPAEGGNISPDAGMVRREKVCAALTTPKGTPPADGWPLVLYAHGTGGSYRSHAGDGAGEALVSVLLDGGTTDGGALPGGYAVLGFDQVGHGTRRGARTDVSPDDIVFNFANPASARGTMAQGSADLLGVARWAKTLDGPDAGLPAIDTSRLVFWGHSQGATEGAMFLALDGTVDGALLSGASASLTDALLSKKAPVNIADSMWIALGEQSPADVHLFHPALSLLQTWTDPVDPVNFARDVVIGRNRSRHVLQIWGKGDTFTATPVQNVFAIAAGLTFVGPAVDDTDLTPAMSAAGNRNGKTAAMRQYDPDGGYDGHFVVFQDANARRDAVRFLVRSAAGVTPQVPEP